MNPSLDHGAQPLPLRLGRAAQQSVDNKTSIHATVNALVPTQSKGSLQPQQCTPVDLLFPYDSPDIVKQMNHEMLKYVSKYSSQVETKWQPEIIKTTSKILSGEN